MAGNVPATSDDKDTFQGHFIVVVSYSSRTGRFHYLDPDNPPPIPGPSAEEGKGDCTGLLEISESLLEEARLSYGTDEDILLVQTHRLHHQ